MDVIQCAPARQDARLITSFRGLQSLVALAALLHLFKTAASDTTRSVTTAAGFVNAVLDPAVHVIYVERDFCVSSSDWDNSLTNPPFKVDRNLTIAGRVDGTRLPVLDVAYVPRKIWLARGVTILIRGVLLLRTRRSMLGQAPGMDLVATIPGLSNKTADPADPSTPTLRLAQAMVVIRACYPKGVIKAAVPLARPAAIPGDQRIDADQPQPGCFNDTTAENAVDVTMASITAPSDHPALERCWSQRGIMVDLAGVAADVSDKGTAINTYYMTHAVNVSYMCLRTMTEECFSKLGPLGCFVTMLSKEAVGQEAATCDSIVNAGGSDSGPAYSGGGDQEAAGQGFDKAPVPQVVQEQGGRQHVSHGAVIAGVVAGVVGSVVVIAALTLLYRYRVKQPRKDPAACTATSGTAPTMQEQQEPVPCGDLSRSSGSGAEQLGAAAAAVGGAKAPSANLGKSCARGLGTGDVSPDPYDNDKGAAATAAAGSSDAATAAAGSSDAATYTVVGLSVDLEGCQSGSCLAGAGAGGDVVAAAAAAAAPPLPQQEQQQQAVVALRAVAVQAELEGAAAGNSSHHAYVRLLLGPPAGGDALSGAAAIDGETASPVDLFDRRRIVTPETPLNPGVQFHAVPTDMDQEVRLLPGPAVLGRGAQGRVLAGVFRGQQVAVKLMGDEADWALNAAAAAAAAGGEGGDEDQGGSDARGPGIGNGEGESELVQRFYSEVEVLGRCQHPNIVRLLAACLTPPRLCLVMERMETSLERLMYGTPDVLLPMPLVLHISLQVALGLAYLHPTIIHRDLKPGNVLLNGIGSATPEVKLADFGISRLRTTAVFTRHPAAGTAAYLAPEAFDACIFGLTSKTDMYGWAVLTYEMLAGCPPWPGLNTVAIAYRVAVCQERPNLAALPPSRRPPRLAEAICRCWDHDPGRRLAAAEVVKELLLLQQALGLAHLACAASFVQEGHPV